MLISIKQAGGFAGIEQLLGSVDLSALSDDDSQKARSSLQDLIRLAADPASSGADRFQYEVEMQEPGQAPKSLIIFDEGDPDRPDMRALAGLASALGLSVT
jgi:hypothetical protein